MSYLFQARKSELCYLFWHCSHTFEMANSIVLQYNNCSLARSLMNDISLKKYLVWKTASLPSKISTPSGLGKLTLPVLRALLRLRHNIQTSLLGSYFRKSSWSTGRFNIGIRVIPRQCPIQTDRFAVIRTLLVATTGHRRAHGKCVVIDISLTGFPRDYTVTLINGHFFLVLAFALHQAALLDKTNALLF